MNKWILSAAVVALTVVIVAAGGWWFLRAQHNSYEAQSACVATVFPVVVMEHNKYLIETLLENLQSDAGGPVREPETTDRVVLSKEIDKRFLRLSKFLREQGENESRWLASHGHQFNEVFEDLVPVFRRDIPKYMNECVRLVGQMTDKCGSLDEITDSNKECMSEFKESVTALVQRQLRQSGN